MHCAQCVKCASESCKAEKVRVRVCVCVHLPFGLSLSDCQVEEDQRRHLSYLICVAATSRPELVFFLVFKTSAGASAVVVCGCRHVCDDEESQHEDLDEGDHVHEDHDDHSSASAAQDCWVMCSLFHSTSCFYSGCYSDSTVSLPPPWEGCTTLSSVSVVRPFCGRSDVIPLIICCWVKFFHVGLCPCSCMRI